MKRKTRAQIEAAIKELLDLMEREHVGAARYIELRAHHEALRWVLGGARS